MNAHTPANWYVTREGRSRLLIRTQAVQLPRSIDDVAICQVMAGAVGDEQAAANARLISAAPDLLAAAQEAKAFILEPTAFEPGTARRLILQLAEAITKAEGRGKGGDARR
jgi:hypothetical protein